MRGALLCAPVLAIAACSFDASVAAGGSNESVADFDADLLAEGDADSDALPTSECASAADGTTCSIGICLGGTCLLGDTTELKGTDLTIVASNSINTAALQRSLDEDRESRWPTSPDLLPIYIDFKLAEPHFLTGVLAEAGGWTHCGGSDIFLSSDGVNWGSPVASYNEVDPLPTNAPAYFSAPQEAEYIRVVVNAGEIVNTGEQPRSYCYISIFRAIAVGI